MPCNIAFSLERDISSSDLGSDAETSSSQRGMERRSFGAFLYQRHLGTLQNCIPSPYRASTLHMAYPMVLLPFKVTRETELTFEYQVRPKEQRQAMGLRSVGGVLYSPCITPVSDSTSYSTLSSRPTNSIDHPKPIVPSSKGLGRAPSQARPPPSFPFQARNLGTASTQAGPAPFVFSPAQDAGEAPHEPPNAADASNPSEDRAFLPFQVRFRKRYEGKWPMSYSIGFCMSIYLATKYNMFRHVVSMNFHHLVKFWCAQGVLCRDCSCSLIGRKQSNERTWDSSPMMLSLLLHSLDAIVFPRGAADLPPRCSHCCGGTLSIFFSGTNSLHAPRWYEVLESYYKDPTSNQRQAESGKINTGEPATAEP